MDVSQIISAYGAYYENSGQNKARVRKLLTQGRVTPGICTPIKTDDTIFRLAQVTLSSIVQPFQKSWTPLNGSAFTPNELKLYHFKVDEDIEPDDIEATRLGFLANDSILRKDWPLVKYLIEYKYIPKINEDMELKEYGKGEYSIPETGVAGPAGTGMNGLRKLLQDGVDGETINSISLGALDKDTIFDQVETFVDGISEVYQGVPMDVCMSPSWRKYYLRDKRANGYYQIPGANQIDESIDFTPQKVKGLPSLSGTDVIFATPKENLLHMTKKSANKTRFSIEETKRAVSFLCDWWEGMGFGVDGAVWTNLEKAV